MDKYKTLPKEGEMLITITVKLDKNRCKAFTVSSMTEEHQIILSW